MKRELGICAGTVQGKPFENMVGSGVEYTFGDWSVPCCSKTNLPRRQYDGKVSRH